MVSLASFFIAKQFGTWPQLHNQTINSYNEWFWRLRVWVPYRTSHNSLPSTLIHRSVLQLISWESARTGGHFGHPFYSEKSLSTFIHMVLLQKVAQDLLDLNGKFASTKCEMLSSVQQLYKSRWRLRALAGVVTRDATVTSSIGFLYLSAQLVSVAFYSVFTSFRDTQLLPHYWRSPGVCETVAFSAPLFWEWSFPKNPHRPAWYLTRVLYLMPFLGGTRSEAPTLALE